MSSTSDKFLDSSPDSIKSAAEALNRGELVGLPTETVYGIAAVATDRRAVLNTFRLKGRPAANPLIVHVGSLEQVDRLVTSIPEFAIRLADTFWPGPITLVLPKASSVPDEVTGGLNTVAIRMPGHPVARAIILATDAPLSAPSANSFMALSPTRAEHISPEILEGLAYVIDGGPCSIGLESTVVDCSEEIPTILRPGGISRAQIEAIVGPVSLTLPPERRSPGAYKRHYSPRTPLNIVEKLNAIEAGIVFGPAMNSNQIQLPKEPVEYSSLLYSTLFALDQRDLNEIAVEAPPQTPEWEAVWDRIKKASS